MKIAFGFVVIVLMFGVRAEAQPAAADFDRLDRDKSGSLKPDELPQGVRANFDRIDTGGDGEISRQEFGKFIELMQMRRNRPGAPNRPEQPRNADRSAQLERFAVLKRDLPYADTDNPRQKLDLLLPKEPNGKVPLIVFIHGGGWQNGDRAGGLGRIAKFVQSGNYAGASIGYRLTDEAQWPQQIYDCKAAIRWLKAHADEYGYDADKIAVYGTSAGGHLVSFLGTTGDKPEFEGKLGSHTDQNSRVTCVANFYGVTDFPTIIDQQSALRHAAPDSPEGKLFGGAIADHKEQAKAASPITHVSAKDAPTLTVHGTDDRTVPYAQGTEFAKALKAAGAPSYFVEVTGGGHGGFPGSETDERLQSFFDKYLRGKDVQISEEPIVMPSR